MVHILKVTPPSLVSDALEVFDEEVRNCFMLSTAIEIEDFFRRAHLSVAVEKGHGRSHKRSQSSTS